MEARPLAGNLVLEGNPSTARRARLAQLVSANITSAAGHHSAMLVLTNIADAPRYHSAKLVSANIVAALIARQYDAPSMLVSANLHSAPHWCIAYMANECHSTL